MRANLPVVTIWLIWYAPKISESGALSAFNVDFLGTFTVNQIILTIKQGSVFMSYNAH